MRDGALPDESGAGAGSAAAATAFRGLPQFVAGCSVGGCVAVLAAHRDQELFQGAVLLAPMLSLERVARAGLNPYLRPLTNVADLLVPTACLAATAENTVMPHLQAVWDADDLCWHRRGRQPTRRCLHAARFGRAARTPPPSCGLPAAPPQVDPRPQRPAVPRDDGARAEPDAEHDFPLHHVPLGARHHGECGIETSRSRALPPSQGSLL